MAFKNFNLLWCSGGLQKRSYEAGKSPDLNGASPMNALGGLGHHNPPVPSPCDMTGNSSDLPDRVVARNVRS